MIERARTTYLLLRFGAAFSLLYPATSAVFDPYSWVGYFPSFARAAAQSLGLSDLVLLHTFGAVEVVLALWILSGIKIFWPSLATTLLLLAIVAFNLHEFPVLFRDLSIAALTAALTLMHAPHAKQIPQM